MATELKLTPKLIEKHLLVQIQEGLNQDGFQIWKGHRMLVKPIWFGNQHFNIWVGKTTKNRLCVHIFIGVRVNHLEDILIATDSRIKPYLQAEMPTVGLELSRLWNFSVPGGWPIDHLEDVPQIIQEILEKIREYAFPYFEKYNTLDAIIGLLQEDTPYGWLNGGAIYRQFRLAAILAFLMQKEKTYIKNLTEKAYTALIRTNQSTELFGTFVAKLNTQDLPIMMEKS